MSKAQETQFQEKIRQGKYALAKTHLGDAYRKITAKVEPKPHFDIFSQTTFRVALHKPAPQAS